MLSDTNARLVAARQLSARRARHDAGRFLAEGGPAVREALRRPGAVIEVFATTDAITTNPWLQPAGAAAGVRVDVVSPQAAAALSSTVTPPGLVAVCAFVHIGLTEILSKAPTLIAGLIEVNEPGNAGTVLRSADAAGADAVVLAGGVDIYNAKAVRASAGSLFHLDIALGVDVATLLADAAAAGLQCLATSGRADSDLHTLLADQALSRPTLWLFGNEAHGLPTGVLQAADLAVRVPIFGQAESLNLAAAAAVCLYASAQAQHPKGSQLP